MKIAIIVGTRPEIIKLSPVIRECQRQNLDYFILHTGQHYSYEMDRLFFEELALPQPKYELNVGSGSHAEETGKMLVTIEKVLIEENPDIVLVEGDTNTVLAAALAASKLHIKVGHVEAGLRSGDRDMPEEINRLLTDHITDSLFAPTEQAKRNLLREGIPEEKIFVTGNTVVDAVCQNLEMARSKACALDKLRLNKKGYCLTTLHRQENVDCQDRFQGILSGLGLIFAEFNLPIIYPIHRHSKKRIEEYKLQVPKGVQLIEPVGYLDFLQLEENARLVLTDSGGIQEEACILHIPCVTLRENTERPETLEIGANILAGYEPESILHSAKQMLGRSNEWQHPFGDGTAAIRAIEIITEQ